MDYRKDSLCWYCKNAVPSSTSGCSWSENFKPVKGWDAIRGDIMHGDGKSKWRKTVESYKVRKCPRFESDDVAV